MVDRLERLQHELTGLSAKELGVLIAHAQALHAKKREQEKAEFLDEVRRMAAERGLDVSDVLGSAAPARAAKPGRAGKLEPRYRNPENPDQAWSGRGRAPVWAAPYKEAGKLEEIAT